MSVLTDIEHGNARSVNFAAFIQDAEGKEEVAHFLKSSTLTDYKVERGGVDEAIAWLKKVERSPRRLLVDISGSDGPLDDLNRLADACEPWVQVYAIGDRNDVGLYRSLLQQGVQDYLVKPLGSGLLRKVLDEEGNTPVRQQRLGKVVAVVGTRGGIGTSSVAVHLARGLIAGGTHRRIVYLDLDVYGGSGACMLGIAGGNALIEVMGNADRLDAQYLERTMTTVDNRLYALSAELDYADPYSIQEGKLSNLCATLSQYYHYIILDVPQRGGALASEAFLNANLACVVAEQSVYSARTLLRLVRHIEAHPNPATVYSIVNQPQPVNRNKVNLKDFVKTIELPVIPIGHDPLALSLSENLASPLPDSSPFAQGIKQLVNLLTGEANTRSRDTWWLPLRIKR
ncbi:AAA family ATPase [Brenneria izbisi]|uniref:AAA family ATPase n=1 Tax=Brenneria izbisi TaxID=2939450 RepID=A0AA42C4X4_9GAMM|nr:AAA family ATPase [Brenneria izbisi]MCV9878709.1 AAA family ATPase [Brenneria izbisi]MCV9882108.1 AAA family ATPase [Brenneria izbisi]